MSMSTYVTGFVPPDEAWQKMKVVWDACQAAHVPVPDAVEKFFEGGAPDPAGQEVELPVQEWSGDGSDGYQISVADIPANVKIIRFYNSY